MASGPLFKRRYFLRLLGQSPFILFFVLRLGEEFPVQNPNLKFTFKPPMRFFDVPIFSGSNFYWREVFERDGEVRVPSTFEVFDRALQLAKNLQPYRERFGVPFVVTSWYRTPEANRRAGGAPNSLHLTGGALDFYPAGKFQEVAEELRKSWPGGLGIYPGHIHVDLGPRRRW